MKITIRPPLSFTQQGQREYNEDFCYPDPLTESTRFFLVCDGMGGLDKGEEASKIVATTVFDYLPTQRPITDADISEVVKVAHQHLKQYLDQHLSLTRMGTTLTLLCLQEGEAIVAHIGDSRVYHIRNGEVLYKTRDHKQVLDMVEADIITPEQAINHPWRNRLSRSVSVRRDSDGHVDKVHIQHIDDIQAGDYFFLCTDGVLEQVTDEILCQILSTDHTNEQKREAILQVCEGKTKDNYSGILVQLAGVEEATIVSPVDEAEPLEENRQHRHLAATIEKPRNASNKIFSWLGALMIIAGLSFAAYLFWPKKLPLKIESVTPVNSPTATPSRSDTNQSKPTNRKPHPPADSNKHRPSHPTKKPIVYLQLKPLVKGLQLAQNQQKKYGVLNSRLEIVLPFDYDEICLCQNQTRLRLKEGKTIKYVAIRKIVKEKMFSLPT